MPLHICSPFLLSTGTLRCKTTFLSFPCSWVPGQWNAPDVMRAVSRFCPKREGMLPYAESYTPVSSYITYHALWLLWWAALERGWRWYGSWWGWSRGPCPGLRSLSDGTQLRLGPPRPTVTMEEAADDLLVLLLVGGGQGYRRALLHGAPAFEGPWNFCQHPCHLLQLGH